MQVVSLEAHFGRSFRDLRKDRRAVTWLLGPTVKPIAVLCNQCKCQPDDFESTRNSTWLYHNDLADASCQDSSPPDFHSVLSASGMKFASGYASFQFFEWNCKSITKLLELKGNRTPGFRADLPEKEGHFMILTGHFEVCVRVLVCMCVCVFVCGKERQTE